MNDILIILQADYLNDYTLIIHFSNGEKRTFDFSSLFGRGICQKLKDRNNEIAFATEFLYEQGAPYQA